MALITGGNLLVFTMLAIALMVIVVLVMFVSVFNLDSLLSVSLVDLVNREQIAPSEIEKETTVVEGITEEKIVEKKLDYKEARQLLGFVEYPVVNLSIDQISIFSPQAIDVITPLSEEEIQQRCSRFGIPFNRAKCLRTERNCATVLRLNEEHQRCLANYGYYLGSNI